MKGAEKKTGKDIIHYTSKSRNISPKIEYVAIPFCSYALRQINLLV
jgi:hypothetical protein